MYVYTRSVFHFRRSVLFEARKSRRDEFNKILNTDRVSITCESWILFPLTRRVRTPFHDVDERKLHDISAAGETLRKKKISLAQTRNVSLLVISREPAQWSIRAARDCVASRTGWNKVAKLVKTHFTRVIETSGVARETVLEVSLNSQPVAVTGDFCVADINPRACLFDVSRISPPFLWYRFADRRAIALLYQTISKPATLTGYSEASFSRGQHSRKLPLISWFPTLLGSLPRSVSRTFSFSFSFSFLFCVLISFKPDHEFSDIYFRLEEFSNFVSKSGSRVSRSLRCFETFAPLNISIVRFSELWTFKISILKLRPRTSELFNFQTFDLPRLLTGSPMNFQIPELRILHDPRRRGEKLY